MPVDMYRLFFYLHPIPALKQFVTLRVLDTATCVNQVIDGDVCGLAFDKQPPLTIDQIIRAPELIPDSRGVETVACARLYFRYQFFPIRQSINT